MTVSVLMLFFAGGHSLYAFRENKKRDEGKRDHRLVDEAEGLGHQDPSFRFIPKVPVNTSQSRTSAGVDADEHNKREHIQFTHICNNKSEENWSLSRDIFSSFW